MAPRELGGRSELDPSGVLLRFDMMLLADMALLEDMMADRVYVSVEELRGEDFQILLKPD